MFSKRLFIAYLFYLLAFFWKEPYTTKRSPPGLRSPFRSGNSLNRFKRYAN